MEAVRASRSQDPRHSPGLVDLKEWNRNGWTYHAKGTSTSSSRFYLYVSILFWFIYLQGFGFRQSQTLYPFSPSLALRT